MQRGGWRTVKRRFGVSKNQKWEWGITFHLLSYRAKIFIFE